MRLHHYTHYEDLTLRDWERYVLTNADPLGIKCGDSVFEVGVGSGAFVQVLQHHYDAKTSGIDLAKPLIDLATRALTGAVLSAKYTPRRTTLIAIPRFCLFLHVYTGTYCTAGAGSGLPFIPDGVFDHVVSHSVFFYLHGETLIRNIMQDMARVLKPGGMIGVLCNNGLRGSDMTGKAKNKQSVSKIQFCLSMSLLLLC